MFKSQEININLQSINHASDDDIVKGEFNSMIPLELTIKRSFWIRFYSIHAAAFYNNVRATKLWLAYNLTDVNCKTNDQFRFNDNLRCVKEWETALYLACKQNNVEIVKYLLERPDINIDLENWDNRKPIN